MIESTDAALASEEKPVNFKLNMIFYWTGAALSLSLLAGAIGWSYQLVVRDRRHSYWCSRPLTHSKYQK